MCEIDKVQACLGALLFTNTIGEVNGSGGGHKRLYRIIDFKRKLTGLVVRADPFG